MRKTCGIIFLLPGAGRFTRTVFVLTVITLLITLSSCKSAGIASQRKNLIQSSISKKIPVKLDTDIGCDIDDTSALIFLLNSPEFDIKLITTSVGNTKAKTKIVAKLLEIANRTDIPIGTGPATKGTIVHQQAWVEDYDLSSYPGKIYNDGVKALVDTIMNAAEPIKLIAIGPLPNISAALELQPRITENAEFVGMHGSIRIGYVGRSKPIPEWNVFSFPKEAQKVFTADWDMTITPLDTCGLVYFEGERYKKIYNSDNPLAKAFIENYRVWMEYPWDPPITIHPDRIRGFNVETKSTTLFDEVAVYLAISTEFLKMEKLGIRVTNDGYTVIDDNARKINCATYWKDMEAYKDFVVERIIK